MSASSKTILPIPDLPQISTPNIPPIAMSSSSVNDNGGNSGSSLKDVSDIGALSLEDTNPRESDPKIITQTANMHLQKYRLSESTEDLQLATSALKDAINLSEDDDPKRLDRLHNYYVALRLLFGATQDISHLNNAISTIQISLQLTPVDSHYKPQYHYELSTALHSRFRLTEDLGSTDLDNAIINAREALVVIPMVRKDQLPNFFNHLGEVLMDRFSHSWKTEDITEAITNLIRAVDLTEGSTESCFGRYHRAGFHCDLGSGYLARFELSDQPEDLELALRHHRRASAICSKGLTHRIPSEEIRRQEEAQTALARSLLKHFMRFGNTESLDEAISIIEALLDQPKITIARTNSLKRNLALLAMLGTLLSTRYTTSENLLDLEKAIRYQRSNLNPSLEDPQTPSSKLTKSVLMVNLATSLRRHFNLTRRIDELEEVVALEKKAIISIPPNHPKSIPFRNNLAGSLLHRYSIFGELADLQAATTLATEALSTISAQNTARPSYLQAVGNALIRRFDHLGDATDADKSLQYLMQGVALLSSNQSVNSGYFHDLGIAFFTRSKTSQSRADTDNAVFYLRKALRLSGELRLSKIPRLNALGLALETRYTLFHQEEDISEAISLFKEAIDLSHDHLWLKTDILQNLGIALQLRYIIMHQKCDIIESVSVFSDSATLEGGNPRSRIISAISWSKSVRLLGEGHPGLASSLDMYKIAMNLLPYLSYIGASVQSRYHKLLPSSQFICNAIATALSTDSLELAMEWIEQGRSIVWRQASQLRNSEYDSLRTTHPEHADRIEELAGRLGKGIQVSSEDPRLDCGPQEYSKLAVEYSECLTEIWKLDGYERFLLPKRFSELRGAAAWGPVVVLNASEYGCEGLILASPSSTLHRIHFPDITFERVLELRRLLRGTLSELELTAEEDDDWKHVRIHDSSPTPDTNVPFRLVLTELWNLVVKPCVEHLQPLDIPNTKKPMHIHWCPLGPFAFLPIHAAGVYEPDGTSSEALSECAVSSYTPTISSLLRPSSRRIGGEQQPSPSHKLLVIGSDASLSSTSTLDAQQEVECIQTQAKASGLADAAVIPEEPDHSSPSKILSQMTVYSSVHFACPIERHPTDPSQSALVLPNSMLRTQDLVYANQTSTPRNLAFLTSGGSALGNERLPEESIHFAAGMLHIGYEHVIATMWDVPVEDKLFVVSEVYKRLWAGERFGSEDVGVGVVLDEVLGELRRRKGERSIRSWASFVHFGK